MTLQKKLGCIDYNNSNKKIINVMGNSVLIYFINSFK